MRTRLVAGLLAVLAVLPMLGPLAWQGSLPRLGLTTDAALAALSPVEQPLTVRTFAGQWEVLLVIGWFGLAYWLRRAPTSQIALVLVGAGLAMLRLGNVWLTAALYVPALASHLVAAEQRVRPIRRQALLVAGAALGLSVVTAASLFISRTPGLPADAAQAARSDRGDTAVFTSWRWAAALQRDLGSTRTVLSANDLPPEYAMDYLRVSLAHASWDAVLRQYGVGLVVLDTDAEAGAAGQVRKSPAWQVVLDHDGVLVARRVDQ